MPRFTPSTPIEFRTFLPMDWSAFAGAEGDAPLYGEGFDIYVIADDRGVSVARLSGNPSDPDDHDEVFLETGDFEKSAAVARALSRETTVDHLRAAGWLEV